MLRLAIQSKGRLNEDSIALLADSGIKVSGSNRALIAAAKGFDMEILYLRDDDIPQAVAMGVADVGIVGLNEVEETDQHVDIAMNLGFGACRLSLAVPKAEKYDGLQWFNGKRIATSYPAILNRFLSREGINAEIHKIAGSVEVAPAVGMADAIFDIVSSGGTLIQNGLVEVEKVLFSEAVLVANKSLDKEKLDAIEKLKFRFRSILDSRGLKYVLLNIEKTNVDAAVALLPGMKSPTLLPLAGTDGWYSLHAVISRDQLWDKIEQLKAIGAEDILILDVENVIP